MKRLNEQKAYSLIGVDGNAFSIMGYVRRALERCKHSKEEINAYLEDAMSGDYNHLLSVSTDIIEMLNNENGYEEGHQYTKPNVEAEWESCKSLVRSNKKSINEDIDDNEEEYTPYQVKKILNYAIADALIKIWDEQNLEFSIKTAKKWLLDAVKNFDWKSFSLTSDMSESLNPIFEDELADDIEIELESEPFYTNFKETPTNIRHSFYMSKDDLENHNLTINDFIEANKKIDLDLLIVKKENIQIMYGNSEQYDLRKLLLEIANNNDISLSELKKYIEH